MAATFGISSEELDDLNSNKLTEKVVELGGPAGLAQRLATDLEQGLASSSLDSRRDAFGWNKFAEIPPRNFFSILWDALQDPTLILLMVAAAIQTILGAAIPNERKHNAWTEGVAIWVAVFIVSGVGSFNDYQKDQQFRKLNAQRDRIEVKVMRDGKQVLILNSDIVVGDLLVIDTGDKVIADGYFVRGYDLVIDEASLTGESDPMKKGPERPWIRSGTQVTEGSGVIIVTAVGEHSEWGRTLALVVGEVAETPLQEKLTILAANIGKVGFFVAVLCLIALMITWGVENKDEPKKHLLEILTIILFCITIVVVAVPEGLPLAVTIALAYSMKKMMKDQNFVRHLAACETMGGATAICSDKTGTLTENRMTVTEGWFAGKKFNTVPDAHELTPENLDLIQKNAALNGKAFLVTNPETGLLDFVGNRTECALLVMLQKLGQDYEAMRKEFPLDRLYGFSSEKKMASALLKLPDGTFRLFNKGAAEMVIARCTHQRTEDGRTVELGESDKARMVDDVITEMASRGLRTLALSYADFPPSTPPSLFADSSPDDNLVLCAVVGIKDPVRKEVPDAVKTCQRAGIVVRMVTGDNINTARHIARECGILTDGGTCMEGPVFRALSDEERLAVVPQLQVLARSSPKDKYVLVQTLQKLGEVVAVTGDGTNDAPALKESDVGLAMGKAGTEVAKEASDIVILDDNFSSIVKSVLWGRNVFNSIRKFLQFQLTINFVALSEAFIAAVSGKGTPLNVMQLLWVNLVMDSFAALALATELPTLSLLDMKPYGRNEPLISKRMWKHIIGVGIYQIIMLALIIYLGPTLTYYKDKYPIEEQAKKEGYAEWATLLEDYAAYKLLPKADQTLEHAVKKAYDKAHKSHEEHIVKKVNSMVFNAFIWMQWFNIFMARRIQDEWDILSGLWQSPIFYWIVLFIGGVQVIIMQTPIGTFFKVLPENGPEWGVALAIGFGAAFTSFLIRVFTGHWNHAAPPSKATEDDYVQGNQLSLSKVVPLSEVEGGKAGLEKGNGNGHMNGDGNGNASAYLTKVNGKV